MRRRSVVSRLLAFVWRSGEFLRTSGLLIVIAGISRADGTVGSPSPATSRPADAGPGSLVNCRVLSVGSPGRVDTSSRLLDFRAACGSGLRPGDHSFSAVATLDGKPAGTDQGIFNVGDVDIEMLDPYTNTTLLRDLSGISGGSFYTYRNYLPLFDELKKYNEEAAQKVKLNVSHQLWSNPWLLGLLVLLLSAEWFFRKREGMV